MRLIHLQLKAKPGACVGWDQCGEEVDGGLQKDLKSPCISYVLCSVVKKAEDGRGG